MNYVLLGKICIGLIQNLDQDSDGFDPNYPYLAYYSVTKYHNKYKKCRDKNEAQAFFQEALPKECHPFLRFD